MVRSSVSGTSSDQALRARPRDRSTGISAPLALSVLVPGMSAKVEIITGRRMVLDYILSPIAHANQEQGTER